MTETEKVLARLQENGRELEKKQKRDNKAFRRIDKQLSTFYKKLFITG